ncbi:right-handed parallel beta-helix repeat-containing protein [uncultured Microbacterium sp.]|uniref:right-handed parallel beta-helix repeat-containing protein n=1 Tax=uncultured Microbacterium sp. TaxID=191216 RepID=UPI0028EB913C|nr:right-handed parallel beta-helix repeat-containing protein [uncultured Microbacterium sp.]
MTPTSLASRVRRGRRGGAWLIGVVAAALMLGGLPANAASAGGSETELLSDSFERSVAQGWGASSSGATYSSWTSAGTTASVVDSVGKLVVKPGGSFFLTTGAPAVGPLHVRSKVRLTASSGNGYFAYMTRLQSDGSAYRVRMVTTAAGTARLSVSRVDGKDETVLKEAAVAGNLTDGWYVFDATVTGEDDVSITANLFPSGVAAPEAQLTVKDSAPERISAPGKLALWGCLSSSAVGSTHLQFDDLTVAKVAVPAGADPSPSPTPSATSTPSATPTPTARPSATPTPSPTPSSTGSPGASAADWAKAIPPASTRGSAPVGTARYAVPAGAIYVDSSATGSTQTGSVGAPYKTVTAAITNAAVGSTIVLRAGEYHESVVFPYGKRGLTIQAYPGEEVWFDGSKKVTNWKKSGSAWVSEGWTATFSSDMLGGQTAWFTNPSYPMAPYPDQLFIDGRPQQQVKSAAEVKPGTFAVDYASNRLILGTDPTGKEVRASDLAQAILVPAAQVTLQGFGVRRYATPYNLKGAIWMQNVDATIRNLVIEDNATIGASVTNDRATLDHVTLRRNGQLGLAMDAAYNSRLVNSIVNENNSEHFADAPVSGGFKITRSRGFEMRNVETNDNHGGGTWFDESCYDISLIDVIANRNDTGLLHG